MNFCVSFCSRLLSAVAVLLFLIAIIDWILRLFNYTLSWLPYAPGRLFELAAIMMIFVIVALLRQIRDSVRKS